MKTTHALALRCITQAESVFQAGRARGPGHVAARDIPQLVAAREPSVLPCWAGLHRLPHPPLLHTYAHTPLLHAAEILRLEDLMC
ncbi:hypothetical protein E2C01_102578 [Portunus trituberculatus]|uniref:Uncharacterized protein n=1 Tax=Portunus trituberculatus TaxID=210409 RepID=A0A5B7KCZ4_PORTR|nr:hypothetical protein [Portunus trituberculatus]